MEENRYEPVKVNIPDYGIQSFSSKHGKGFSMTMEHDPYFELFFIRHGKGVCKTHDREIKLEANSLLLIQPNQPHVLVDDKKSPLSLYGICFDPKKLSQYDDEALLIADFAAKMKQSTSVVFQNDYIIKSITDCFKEILFEQTECVHGYRSKIRQTLFSLMVKIIRTKSDAFSKKIKIDPIEVSLDYISQNFYKPLVVNELAQECGLSTRRYTDLFKQKTGKTCINYINVLRLEYAKKRLAACHDVSMAMHDSGFYDLSHFYKLFKKHTGLTPKQFINS